MRVYGGDYQKVVREYDSKDTVFFLDPPYPGYNVDVGKSEFDEERFFKLLKSLKGRFLITYGIRGKFPELVKGSDFWSERIRTRRSIAHMRGVGGSSVLTQLLVTNYEPTTKVDGTTLAPAVQRADREAGPPTRPRRSRRTDAVSFRRMTFAPNRVAADLDLLRQADPEGKLAFGASAHRYRLDPPLDDSEVTAFEARYGIVLPPDYREFVLHVGNGGAGPYYGVFRLGEMDDGHGHAAWEAGTFVGDPRKPFPHSAAWNLSADELEELQANEDDDEEIIRRYWVPVDGAIPLCHEGCALRDWLVVTGPEAGHVWHDATADFDGWWPVLDSTGARATFGAWYADWLCAAVTKLGPR